MDSFIFTSKVVKNYGKFDANPDLSWMKLPSHGSTPKLDELLCKTLKSTFFLSIGAWGVGQGLAKFRDYFNCKQGSVF